jgi:hypothetical protein
MVEYKVWNRTMAENPEDTAEALEKQLNEIGKDNWKFACRLPGIKGTWWVFQREKL